MSMCLFQRSQERKPMCVSVFVSAISVKNACVFCGSELNSVCVLCVSVYSGVPYVHVYVCRCESELKSVCVCVCFGNLGKESFCLCGSETHTYTHRFQFGLTPYVHVYV